VIKIYIVFIVFLSAFLSADNITLTKEEKQWIDENHLVSIRVANIEPFQIHEANNHSGIAVDVIKSIFKKYNISYQFIPYEKYTYKQALQSINNKDGVDIFLALTPTKEKEKKLLFTSVYASPPIVIFTKNNSSFIGNMNDLNGKIVAVQKFVPMQKILEEQYPKIKLKVIPHPNSTLNALKAVSEGKADAFISNLATGSYLISRYNLYNLKVAAPTPFGESKIAMALRNDWSALQSIINRELSQLTENEKTSIRNKYLSIKYEHGIDKDDVVKWILFITAIFTVILLIFYITNKKNKKLNKKLNKKTTELLLFKNIVDNVKVGVTISKINCKYNVIEYVNKEFENITGYSENDVMGKSLKLLHGDDTDQKELQVIRDAIQNKSKCQVELRNYKKDGTLFTNLLSLTPIFDKKNNFLYYVGIQQDISEIKIKNLQLEHHAKLASMGEMIGNISHQWRQPLSVISTGVTGMKIQKEYNKLDDELFFNTCDLINENAQYLSQTIDDFSNFIKGDTKSVRFDLKNDTDSFIKLVDSTIKQYHIQVILDLEENINIVGYPNELIQCFINIFNNAKDAIIENNISEDERYILISQKVVDQQVIINFKDNAGGIPRNIIDKIFEPYFTTKHQSQGTGLGLHMSYNLITKGMKGTIKVENVIFDYNEKSYKGASFTISIPINDENLKSKDL